MHQFHGDNSSSVKAAILETILSPRKRTPQTLTNVNHGNIPPIPTMDFDKGTLTSSQSPSAQNSPKCKVTSNKNPGNFTYRCGGDHLSPRLNSFVLNVGLNSIILNKLPPDGKFTFR